MSGQPQNSISEQLGVSKQTINKWVAINNWTEQRAALRVTCPELVNKLLLQIDKLIEDVSENEDPKQVAGLGDKISKLAAVIKSLDKKANAVDTVEVFMAFGKWLQVRAAFDDELTPELIKSINKYQDFHVSELLSTGKSWEQ